MLFYNWKIYLLIYSVLKLLKNELEHTMIRCSYDAAVYCDFMIDTTQKDRFGANFKKIANF